MMRFFVTSIFGFITILVVGLSVMDRPNAGKAQSDSDIRVVAWNHDGTKLAVGHEDGSIKIWDIESDQLLRTIQSGSDRILSLAWSPDGSMLASGNDDTQVRVLDSNSGNLVTTLEQHSSGVTAVAWTINGDKLLTFDLGLGSSLYNWFVWDATSPTWDLISSYGGGSVLEIAANPDGTIMATGHASEGIEFLDTNDFAGIGQINLREGLGNGEYGVYSVAWSPDGNRIASGSLDGGVKIWDVGRIDFYTAPPMLFDLHANDEPDVDWNKSTVEELRYSNTGNTLMAVSADGTVRLWDANTGEVLQTLDLGASLHGAELSPDGRELAYGDLSNDEAPEIVCLGDWDISSGESVTITPMPCGDESGATSTDAQLSQINDIAWSPNGNLIAGGSDQGVQIWDAVSRSPIDDYPIAAGVQSVAWSPDSTKIAIGQQDGKVSIWDTMTDTLITSEESHADTRVNGIDWSHDSTKIASIGGFEGGMTVWEALTLVPITYGFNIFSGFDIAFSIDDSSVIVGTEAGIDVIDSTTGALVGTTSHYNEGVLGVDSDQNLIVSGNGDGTVRLWDATTVDEIAVFQGHNTIVDSVAFDSSGTRIASADRDGNIRLWDVATGATISILEHTGSEFDWSPDGTRIAFANGNDQLQVVCVGSERPEDLSEPIMRTPCDTTRVTSPTYSWWAADGADRYQIVVKNSAENVYPLGEDGIWVEAMDVCDGNSCQFQPSDSTLEPDTYSWAIRSYDADTDTYSEWQVPETTFEVMEAALYDR